MRLPRALGLVEVAPHRLGEGQDEVGDLGEVALEAIAVDRRLAEAGAQGVVMGAEAVEQRIEFVEMSEIADTDGAAANLVLIGRTDAAPGGADLAGAAGIFAQGIEVAVDRQDERAGLGDAQDVRGDGDALAGDALDLAFQRPWVEDDAIADDRRRAADDARGEQRKLVRLAAHDQRMAGVVAALEADDHVGAAGEPVDDLALALVAPLRADDGDVAHFIPLGCGGALGEGWPAVKNAAARPSSPLELHIMSAPPPASMLPSTATSATASPSASRRPRLKVAMLIPASPSAVPSLPMKPGESVLTM